MHEHGKDGETGEARPSECRYGGEKVHFVTDYACTSGPGLINAKAVPKTYTQ